MDTADAMAFLIAASIHQTELAQRIGGMPTGEVSGTRYPDDDTATGTLEVTLKDGSRKRYSIQVTED